MPMGNLLALITTIYFVVVILAVYHLQQKEFDRMQRQDENNCLLDEVQRRLRPGDVALEPTHRHFSTLRSDTSFTV
jgi:hypothetical protein